MSFEVHDCAAVSVNLTQAILLYEGGSRQPSGIRYATIHPVEATLDNSPPQILAGRPLDQNSLKAVCASLLGASRVRSGILSDNILSIGLEHVVWWQRPDRRTYFFDCKADEGKRICVGKRSGVGLTPGIVFVAKGQSMLAYAVKGDARPDANTPLCHLPAMNVWEDGRVCTGSMALPDSTVADSIAAWEKSFWDSYFTHPNHPKPVNYKGGIHQFSIDLLDGKFATFPQRVLRPIKNLTLGRLVDRLDGIPE